MFGTNWNVYSKKVYRVILLFRKIILFNYNYLIILYNYNYLIIHTLLASRRTFPRKEIQKFQRLSFSFLLKKIHSPFITKLHRSLLSIEMWQNRNVSSFFNRCPIGESKGSRAERRKKKKEKERGFATSTCSRENGCSGGGRRGSLDGARTLSKALSLAAVSAARRTVRLERVELALGSGRRSISASFIVINVSSSSSSPNVAYVITILAARSINESGEWIRLDWIDERKLCI